MKKFLIESLRAKKNKPLSFVINFLGLTLGFTAVIVMYTVIVSELRHDRNYTDSMEEVYRVELEADMGGIVPAPLAELMRTKVVEVNSATAVNNRTQQVGTVDLPNVQQKVQLKVIYTDSCFLTVFPLKMIEGGGPEALATPDKALISRSAAVKLFGSTDVTGRQLMLENKTPLYLSGVYEDFGGHAIFSQELILLDRVLALLGDESVPYRKSWASWQDEVFVRVFPGSDPEQLRAHAEREIQQEVTDQWDTPYDEPTVVRPFNDIYFSKGVDTNYKTSDASRLTVLGLIAVLILAIAIVNYVNIYTARSTEVIRAMGIKRIMGASRSQLIGFVIFDSVLVALLSAVAAYVLAVLLVPVYPALLDMKLSMELTWDMGLTIFGILPLVCGVLSGLFPAFSLTRVQPLDAMANRSSGGKRMSGVRNALIVVQFSISIALIVAALTINKQMIYISSFDPGYNRENVITVSNPGMLKSFDLFRAKLLQNPKVLQVAAINGDPMNVDDITSVNLYDGQTEDITVDILQIDEHAMDLLGLEMLEGQPITADNVRKLSGGHFIVNESFYKLYRQYNPDGPFPNNRHIGLFKDYQHRRMTQGVRPLILVSIYSRWGGADAYIKVSGEDMDGTLAHIEQAYREIFPDDLYSFGFMDEAYNRLYHEEQLFRSQLLTFSILAIMIGCLGLFALVGFSVEKRKKEIALRKVHGARIGQVMAMLCISFLRWLGIAFLVAVPVALYFMRDWVSQYAYQTSISWWLFALAGLITLLIALVTVLGQSYRAATANPAEALKAE